MNPFKLLVMAVATLALLWIFFTYLAPIFQRPLNPQSALQQGLQNAQTSPGHTFSVGTIELPRDYSLNNTAFAQPSSETFFDCASPYYCCARNEACSNAIEGNETHIRVKKRTPIPVWSRCTQVEQFLACKLYFGMSPAQLSIQTSTTSDRLDLEQQPYYELQGQVKNTGGVTSPSGQIQITIEKQVSENLAQEPRFQTNPLPAVDANQSAPITIRIPFDQVGTYRITLRAIADNAGYDEKTMTLEVTQTQPACRALVEENREKLRDPLSNNCIEKLPCSNCPTAFECRDQWREILANSIIQSGDATFAERALSENEC